MGTERDRVCEISCICGNGKFEIDECTPDHGWPVANQISYETRISCEHCRAKYELIQQEGHIVVVEKVEIIKQQKIKQQWHELGDSIMALPSVNAILQSFIAFLETQRSIAAIHRILMKERLVYDSIGTFRKKWAGAAKWTERHIRPSSLLKVMKLVDAYDDLVIDKIKQHDSLWNEYNQLLPMVGQPVYKI